MFWIEIVNRDRLLLGEGVYLNLVDVTTMESLQHIEIIEIGSHIN